jgi:hypothetical protein
VKKEHQQFLVLFLKDISIIFVESSQPHRHDDVAVVVFAVIDRPQLRL